MDYIRYRKAQPDYDPNTGHCLYGLDANFMSGGGDASEEFDETSETAVKLKV